MPSIQEIIRQQREYFRMMEICADGIMQLGIGIDDIWDHGPEIMEAIVSDIITGPTIHRAD